MRAAIARPDPSPPRLLRVVPPPRSTADVVAELVAHNAALVARIDLLALHLGRMDAENAALRDRCDILAQYLEPLIAQRVSDADRELRAKALSPAPIPAPVPIVVRPIPASHITAANIISRRRTP